MTSQLREELQELAKLDAVKQLAQLELLREIYGHSVTSLTGAESGLQYNCVMYAMNVHEHGELYQLLVHLTYGTDKNLGVVMDTNFLQMLIDDGDLHKVTTTSNCLAVYSTSEKITHIGVVLSSGRVISKWGTAHLYEHEVLECPLSYGDDVDFYNSIDPEVCVDRFFDYAESKGVKFG